MHYIALTSGRNDFNINWFDFLFFCLEEFEHLSSAYQVLTPKSFTLAKSPICGKPQTFSWEFNMMPQTIAMLQIEHWTAVSIFWQWWQTVMCSPSSAERTVYSDLLWLEQDISSEHCQNPLWSTSQQETVCVHETRAVPSTYSTRTGVGAYAEVCEWE